MTPYTWCCPYCNHHATITQSNHTGEMFQFDDNNKHGATSVGFVAVTCPNPLCREVEITAYIRVVRGNQIQKFSLRPQSNARPFPSYIPGPILDDYRESCLIRELSPKASATLARRCLQGIIRDFWRVKGKSLKVEIDKLKEKVEPSVWKAIDAVRSVGNIGAHMEKDINVVVEVDPKEADLLLGLIEMLLKEWYVARQERDERLAQIVAVAETKKLAKKGIARPDSSAQQEMIEGEASA